MYNQKNQQISTFFKSVRYNNKYLAEQQVKQLVHQIHSLQPGLGNFMSNNGTSERLFKLEGTIPITYQYRQYNIPMCIWLPLQFPMVSPRCYVTPTSGMSIKPKHILVDTTGFVYHPYLSNWNINTGSNLTGLIGTLCSEFGKNPPVYSGGPSQRPMVNSNFRQPQQPRPQPVQPQPQPQPRQQWGQPSWNQSQPRNSQPIKQQNVQSMNNSSVINKSQSMFVNNSSNINKSGNVKSDFSIAIKKHLQNVYDSLNKDNQKLAQKQKEVENHRSQIEQIDENVRKEKEALIKRKNDLSQKIQFLEKWLDENESKTSFDIDKTVTASDLWSQQGMDATAMDHASTDTLLELDKALDDGVITIDIYLKSLRKVARDQFLQRALSKAVFNKQDQMVKQSGRHRG